MILDGLLSHFQDTLSFEYVLLNKKLIINLKAGLFLTEISNTAYHLITWT